MHTAHVDTGPSPMAQWVLLDEILLQEEEEVKVENSTFSIAINLYIFISNTYNS